MDLLLNTIALDPHRWTPEKTPYYTLDRLLPHIAGTDFSAVEVWQHHLSHATEAEVRAYRNRGDNLGLSFPIVGVYPQLHLEGDAAAQEMDAVQRLLDYAGLLDAHVFKIFPGNLASEEATAEQYNRSIDFMQEMARRAASAGLTITAETHENTLCDTRDACLRFLEDVDASNLHVCYQPYDFTDTAQAIADYKALADHVIHIHYQGRKNDQMSLLKNADLDYRAITQALVEQGYDGYLCIEFVKDCVVPTPADFNLMRVLRNARRDHTFVRKAIARAQAVSAS